MNSYISLGKFEPMGGDVGRMATSISYLQETLQLQENLYNSEEDPRRRAGRGLGVAQTLLEVGRQHHQLDDPKEAIEHYLRAIKLIEETLAIREKEGSEQSVKAVLYSRFTLSEACSILGVAYSDVGQMERALAEHQRALELRKVIVGKNHPSVAECFSNIGTVHFAKGDFQKAAEHYELALELLAEAAGGKQDGAHVALTLYNIGVCRGKLGQYAAEASALQQALDLAERTLGSEHRQVDLIRMTLQQAGQRQASLKQAG